MPWLAELYSRAKDNADNILGFIQELNTLFLGENCFDKDKLKQKAESIQYLDTDHELDVTIRM